MAVKGAVHTCIKLRLWRAGKSICRTRFMALEEIDSSGNLVVVRRWSDTTGLSGGKLIVLHGDSP